MAGLNGWALIQQERERQVQEEGYSHEHDQEHVLYRAGDYTRLPLLDAAICYAKAGRAAVVMPDFAHRLSKPEHWPWAASYWKPSDDPVRNLVKAGALIAAEIDRLQRTQ